MFRARSSRRLRGRDREQWRGGLVPRRHRGLRRGRSSISVARHGRPCGAQALARERAPHARPHPDRARKLGRARRRHRCRRRRLPAEAVSAWRNCWRGCARSCAAPPGMPSSVVTVGDIRLDERQMKVSVRGVPITLSPLEYRLVAYLFRHRGRVVSQHELDENVYGHGEDHDFERPRGSDRPRAPEAGLGSDRDAPRLRLHCSGEPA